MRVLCPSEELEIGSGAQIDDDVLLGYPPGRGVADRSLRLGPRARLRSGTVLYAGSSFGAGLETGHHVVIREQVHAGAQRPQQRAGQPQARRRHTDHLGDRRHSLTVGQVMPPEDITLAGLAALGGGDLTGDHVRHRHGMDSNRQRFDQSALVIG